MKLVKAAIALTAFFSLTAQANTYNLPSNCEYGRVKSYDMYAGQELANAVEAGYDIYQDPGFNTGNYSAWIALVQGIRQILNGFDYLRIEVPKHVLQGREFRAKGNLFDRYANVLFNNSEFGYIGTDKSNLDANAYLNMKFSRTYGVGLVWVNRSSGMCSAEAVWVQKPPRVTGGSVSVSGGQIRANVAYLIDKYSRAAKDTTTPVRITIVAASDIWMTSDSASTTISSSALTGQKTLGLYPRTGGGSYTVNATVHDGTYSHSYTLGSVMVPGSMVPPCQGCQIP